MTSVSVTRASLLLRIRNPHDRLAWGELVELYAPLIHAYAMRRGLQDADAEYLGRDKYFSRLGLTDFGTIGLPSFDRGNLSP